MGLESGEVVVERLAQAAVMQGRRGVVDGKDRCFLGEWLGLAVGGADAERGKELREGVAAERGDHLGLNERELQLQPGEALLLLFGRGVAVLGRPEFHHVGDVDVFTFEADRGEELVQKLPGCAHERDAELVLLLSRRLADKDDLRLRVAVAEDRVRRRGQSAAFPGEEFLAEFGDGLGGGHGGHPSTRFTSLPA